MFNSLGENRALAVNDLKRLLPRDYGELAALLQNSFNLGRKVGRDEAREEMAQEYQRKFNKRMNLWGKGK